MEKCEVFMMFAVSACGHCVQTPPFPRNVLRRSRLRAHIVFQCRTPLLWLGCSLNVNEPHASRTHLACSPLRLCHARTHAALSAQRVR